MPTFTLDPVITVQHARYRVLRTIADALAMARDMATDLADKEWQDLVRNLERVKTEDDALEAAVALEGLLERRAMLVQNSGQPIMVPSTARPAAPPAYAAPASRAVSSLYAAARATPEL